MFNALSGELSYKDETRVFLQTGGVEWEIHTTRISANALPEPGRAARLYVHLYVREDQLRLYGFATAAERAAFLDLLKVEGVGPKQAQKILSGIEVHQLAEALETENLDRLSSIPGIGPKTAQKILLKLRGKLSLGPAPGESLEEDLAGALAGMGFDRKAVRGAVATVMRGLRDSALPREELERELFKRALALLGGQEAGL
ncbi:MAG: Holliday junction DNA helicase RuvA [Spirochaetes bacterium GWB1_66_5]|nr:MAG: Holliday junction DNA helicase RuvA [Spirochaetes bacterium GWB1_66_5]